MSAHIEEDFRFATSDEVNHYTPEDLIRKPHICGFEFSQLLDQIDGQLIKVTKTGRTFRAFLRAPGGTALWIAKHIKSSERQTELVIAVEAEFSDDQLLTELNEMPGVIAYCQYDGNCLINDDAVTANCSVLACSKHEAGWLSILQTHRWLRRVPVIALDPRKKHSHRKDGDYFMGSSVWVALWGS